MSSSFASQHSKLVFLETCMQDLPAPNLALSEYWKLDEKIRAEFTGSIQMWEQGLITCMELLQSLQEIVNQPRR